MNIKQQIKKILSCNDEALVSKISEAIDIFKKLDIEKEYQLAFSGGKDSHALVAAYLLYLKLGLRPLKARVVFADTKLEINKLYSVIENLKNWCENLNIKFDIVSSDTSYWYWQFAIGYPVPDFRVRWCTGKLKILPMKSQAIPITGRHRGESIARDKRLACNSGECGIDKIKDKTIEPLLNFSNCDIWDFLYYCDGTVLYNGVFNSLKSLYQGQETDKGSLRMGCFMCPVISKKTLENDCSSNNHSGIKVREILEKLRLEPRINNPRTKKKGAICIDSRRRIWAELDKEYLLENNWISSEEISLIEYHLELGSYPKTYSQEWIEQEHQRLIELEKLKKVNPYYDLPLFSH